MGQDYDAIDCPECGRLFADFGTLAEHVKESHSTSPRAARADEVTHHIDEAEERMSRIPSSNRAPQQNARQSTSTIPSAQSAAESSDYNPFLKAENIGRKVGATAVLILTGEARLSQSQFGQQIIAEVKHKRGVYDWGVKLNSPNHRYLDEMFGTNTAKWRGKKVPVVVLENMGRLYIAIERPAQQQAPARGKAKARKSTRRK